MNVLDQIISWSRGCPVWQRDALRRLVLKGELSDADISALTEVCKSERGLASVQAAKPLERVHLPGNGAGSECVTVHSLFHESGVNALAENQTLNFCSGLTVVYGDNAAGKSGVHKDLQERMSSPWGGRHTRKRAVWNDASIPVCFYQVHRWEMNHLRSGWEATTKTFPESAFSTDTRRLSILQRRLMLRLDLSVSISLINLQMLAIRCVHD